MTALPGDDAEPSDDDDWLRLDRRACLQPLRAGLTRTLYALDFTLIYERVGRATLMVARQAMVDAVDAAAASVLLNAPRLTDADE